MEGTSDRPGVHIVALEVSKQQNNESPGDVHATGFLAVRVGDDWYTQNAHEGPRGRGGMGREGGQHARVRGRGRGGGVKPWC